MSCVEWEERVSLYAGGDLALAEAQAVERHVAECDGCRELLSGLRDSLDLVWQTRGDSVDAAHFAAVRACVLAEIELAPARRWRFVWGFALTAAAAVAMAALLWPRPELRIALPMPQAPMAPVVAKAPGPVRSAPFHLKVRTPQVSESIVVRVETDNPDVVIYWIADTKGETK